MLRTMSVALLIVSSPLLAQEAAPAETNDSAGAAAAAPKIAYKTKKVCRSIEVVGSSIPRTSCTTKKIPIKPAEQEEAKAEGEPASDNPQP